MMLTRTPRPTPPGELLQEEWLVPLGWSQSTLAKRMGIDVQVINGIVRGRRAITARTALRLAKVLNTSPEFWMNLQTAHDLHRARSRLA